MSVLNNSNAISTGGAYNLESSLRLRESASADLSRTPTSAGNRKTWTWSAWVKLGTVNNTAGLFMAYGGNSDTQYGGIFFAGSNLALNAYNYNIVTTVAAFRDPSAWYHVVVILDTTQATSSNRVKIYVNGVLQSVTTGTMPSQNTDLAINQSAPHALGSRSPFSSTLYFDGYMTEVNFVDGQALTPSDFGETDTTTGVWKPKEYTGTYGTNGFYLPMKETQQATGFNTVLYTGNGTELKVTGVGFNPDLVWVKRRDNAVSYYRLIDSVRGGDKRLASNDTGGETTASTLIQSFDADGYTVGTDTGMNASGDRYVAWCWDAGSADTLTGYGDFDGTGDYLSAPASEYANYINGSGDFTIEWWVNYDALPSDGGWYAQDSGSAVVSPFNLFQQTNNWRLYATTANGAWNVFSNTLLATTSLTTNRWYHIACVRNGSTLTLYVDGVSQGSQSIGTASLWQDTSHNLSLFNDWQSAGGGGGINGKISNYRIVKGTAVYTSNFTPPTAPLTAISGTTLLTCNRPNTFDDESGNITITANGNAFTGQYDLFIEDNNTDGTITSTVRANPATGFSVVTYTGTGALATVGHGLGSSPKFIIVKQRNAVRGWITYNNNLASNQVIYLNATNASNTDTTAFNATAPTSSVFTVGTSADTNQSSGTYVAYCFSEVAGYSKFGSYSGTGASGNTITTGFRPAFVMIKRTDSANNWFIHDNTRDPDNPTTQSLYPNLSDAEVTETGPNTWNTLDDGFELLGTTGGSNASGGTYIYMAFADTRDAQFNFDASGNKNNWTANNINSNASSETTYDIMNDVPTLTDEDTANFATLNPLKISTSTSLSDGNLYFSSTLVAGYRCSISTIGVSSGKFYWEWTAGSSYTGVGIANENVNLTSYLGIDSNSWQYTSGGGVYHSNVNSKSYTSYSTGAIIGVAFDADNGYLWFSKDGVWQGGASISEIESSNATNAAFNNIPANTYFAAVNDSSTGGAANGYINFGQRPFKYTPPTGYKKLNTYNLPDSTIVDGSQYFDTVTWTGNGGTQDISLEFSPDLVWAKDRSAVAIHMLSNTISGPLKSLSSNDTTAEASNDAIRSFNSNGFTTGTWVNTSSNAFVGWSWRGSDSSAVSNTDGTITSTVSANTDSGFSVVTYTAQSNGNDTVGHGLSQTPEIVFWKNRTTDEDWLVTSTLFPNPARDFLKLNLTSALVAFGSDAYYHTLTTIRASTRLNDTDSYVAYCFHSVEGFSKFGSFTANNSSDGNFIYLGFRPRWIMCKQTSGAGGAWFILDTARNTFNVMNNILDANSSGAERNDNIWDATANGMKLRIALSGDFIYMAFAENPFKQSLAR